MASSYDISGGDGRVELVVVDGTYVATQLVADATLDANIKVKLQHSSDGLNFEDLPESTANATMSSGGDSVLLQSFTFVLKRVYLYVTVGGATTGIIDIFTSTKKKENSGDVNATISDTLDVSIQNEKLNVAENVNSLLVSSLNNIEELMREQNILIRKILP